MAGVLAIIAGALVLGAILGVATVLLMDPSVFESHRIDPFSAIAGQGVLDLTVIVAMVFAIPRAASLSLRELGFRTPDLTAAGIALLAVPAAVILATVVTDVVTAVTHHPEPKQQTIQIFLGLHEPWKIAAFALFGTLVAPVAEELIFRVFLFNVGLRYGGFWMGAIVSAPLFGLAHGLDVAIPLAFVGFVLCSVYYLTRNAFSSMITHASFNMLTLVVLMYFPKLAG